MFDERDLRIALEHPRGTEVRRLGPYREALQDPHRYAALPVTDRDAIVAWVALREAIAARGVDNDPANLADPLIPAARLRAFVLEGERLAAGIEPAAIDDPLMDAVSQIRGH